MAYTKNNQEGKIKVYIIAGILLLLAIILWSGWRPTGHFNLEGGTIEINVPESESKIFIDNIEEYETKKANETYTVNHVSIGKHSVAVSKKGYWPWLKNIEVQKDVTTKLQAFTLTTTPHVTALDETDKEYKAIQNEFYSHAAPTDNTKLSSPHKLYKVWIDNNTIFAEWTGNKDETPAFFCLSSTCASRIEVLVSTKNINDVQFYKNYDDIIVLSNEESTYALDINKNGTQNFQPYLSIPNASFIRKDSKLYIQSHDTIVYDEF